MPTGDHLVQDQGANREQGPYLHEEHFTHDELKFRQFQEEGMLRIRITHKALQAAGEMEERALKEIKERLHDLGLSQR